MGLAAVLKGYYRSMLSTWMAPVGLREMFLAGASAAHHECGMIQNLCRLVKCSEGKAQMRDVWMCELAPSTAMTRTIKAGRIQAAARSFIMRR